MEWWNQWILKRFSQSIGNWMLVGSKNMVKIFECYRGVQVILPLHLYNREAAKQQIVKRYDGTNQAELTRLYGYSERWTRAILRNMEH